MEKFLFNVIKIGSAFIGIYILCVWLPVYFHADGGLLERLVSNTGNTSRSVEPPHGSFEERKEWAARMDGYRDDLKYVRQWAQASEVIGSDIGTLKDMAPIAGPNSYVSGFTDGGGASMNLEVVGERGTGILTIPTVHLAVGYPDFYEREFKKGQAERLIADIKKEFGDVVPEGTSSVARLNAFVMQGGVPALQNDKQGATRRGVREALARRYPSDTPIAQDSGAMLNNPVLAMNSVTWTYANKVTELGEIRY